MQKPAFLIQNKSRLLAGSAGLLVILAGLLFFILRKAANKTAAESITYAPNTIQVERGDVQQTISAPGLVVDAGGMLIQAGVDGVVEEIFVHPGESVSKGQTLLRLGERQKFEQEITKANIELMEAQKELGELHPDTLLSQALLEVVEAEQDLDNARDERVLLDCQRATEETLELARSDVAIAKSALLSAQEGFDAVADATEDDLNRKAALERLQDAHLDLERANANLTWYLGQPTQDEIDEMDARLEVAASKYRQAEERLEQARQNQHPDLLLAQAKVENARNALQSARDDLQKLEIKAPFDGLVAGIQVRAGQPVALNEELLQLVNPAGLQIEATVTEEDLPYIREGMVASIFLDALPEEDLSGKIAHILPERASNERALYTVIVQPDEMPAKVFPGMTADASLIIEAHQDVLRLPRSVVRARSDGSAEVQVWRDGQRESRSIMSGLRGDSYIEILSGLEEGEQVVAE